MNNRYCLVVILCTFILSCHDNDKTGYKIIDIQPFAGIPADHTQYVVEELTKFYPHVSLNKPIQLPQSAFYAERNRYRADSLIRYLRTRTPKNHVTIGLTNKDISTTNGKVRDWGVMGLGYSPGESCIASTFRLSANEKKMQLFKVAIHELGHTEGLPHCPIKSCFMRDAEGGNPTNEEKEFCHNCKKYLKKRGWQIN